MPNIPLDRQSGAPSQAAMESARLREFDPIAETKLAVAQERYKELPQDHGASD